MPDKDAEPGSDPPAKASGGAGSAPAGKKPESKNAKTEAKPAPAETKPAPAEKTEPAPAEAKPAPAKAKPAPAEKKPGAEKAKPEAKPAPAEAKPAPAKATPAPAETKPTPAEKTEPAPAETKPAPAEPALPEFEKGLSDRIVAQFGERAQIRFVKPDRVGIRVAREDVREVAAYLRDQMNFDHAESVTGVDYPADKEIEVVYHLGSYGDESLARQVLELATRAPREDVPRPGRDSTVLPSLREVFYSVEFHERECFEMLGVYFEDHPDNRRLLLPEDWADIPPLRKDFAIKGR